MRVASARSFWTEHWPTIRDMLGFHVCFQERSCLYRVCPSTNDTKDQGADQAKTGGLEGTNDQGPRTRDINPAIQPNHSNEQLLGKKGKRVWRLVVWASGCARVWHGVAGLCGACGRVGGQARVSGWVWVGVGGWVWVGVGGWVWVGGWMGVVGGWVFMFVVVWVVF